MQSTSPSVRKTIRLVCALQFAALVAGCASYGSFDENEPPLETSLLGGLIEPLGIAREEEQIEYSARAPLVAPPTASALPQPGTQSAAIAADPNWPTGSQQRMAQVLQNENQTLVFTPGVDGVDIAATQALAERTRRVQAESNSGVSRPLTPEEMQREVDIHTAREQATVQRDQAGTVRARRFLTDPPLAARTPSAQAAYGVEAEEVEEESSPRWWPF